jgi:nucleotide-binding universal stress UspA family protein
MTETEERAAGGRVVVGVDGSEPANVALRWAAEEAFRRGASLDVVHAWLTPYPLAAYDMSLDPDELESAARTLLDTVVDDALSSIGEAPSDVRRLVIQDEGAEALDQVAEGADLLVVGSRGRGGFSDLLVGSVSLKAVQTAPCPVVVVPAEWDGTATGRILVGVDGSQPSYGALNWAVVEAGLRGARLDVVHAYDYPQMVTPFGPVMAIDWETIDKASRDLLEEMIAGAVGAAETPPESVESISVNGSAARSLLEAAQGADLLVVGSRGRGTLRGLLLGSVSQQCVHHASCPVAVVRPREM